MRACTRGGGGEEREREKAGERAREAERERERERERESKRAIYLMVSYRNVGRLPNVLRILYTYI